MSEERKNTLAGLPVAGPGETGRSLDRRQFIGAAALGLSFPRGAVLQREREGRPNILHIMVDQMQWAAMSGRSQCRTPNISRMAEQGIRFERSYTPSALCCPARAMLCTGSYHWHNGVFNQVHVAMAVRQDMFPHVITYSQRLKEAGYRQGYVGKWHASYLRTPLDFGYDEIAAPIAYNPRLLRNLQTNPDGVPRPTTNDKVYDARWFRWPGTEPFTMWGHRQVSEENTNDWWTAESGIRMMRRFAKQRQPWHLEVSFIEPHDPYITLRKYLDHYSPVDIPVPKSFYDTFQGKPNMHRRESATWGAVTEDDYRQGRAHYYACCEQVDVQIGRLLDAVEQTGQAGNTLVTFSTDHGDLVGNHRMWIKEWMPYEECYRIPMTMRWPARIQPGLVSHRLVQLHDLAYTYVDAAGAAPLQYTEGRSLLPLAKGSDPQDWPDQILCAYYGGEYLYTQRMVITERYKYVFNGFDFDECYDLEKDPEEMLNRVDDKSYAEVVDDMRARLYELMNQNGDPYGDIGPRLPDKSVPLRYAAGRYLPRGKRQGK